MLTFKACKHNTCEITIAMRQNLFVLMQISHLSKHFKTFKKWKTWIQCHCLCQRNPRYICYSLTSKDPFPKLFSLDTMPCVHWVSFCCCNHLSNTLMNVQLMVIQLELNAIGYKLVFIIIQSLHQSHDMH